VGPVLRNRGCFVESHCLNRCLFYLADFIEP
jgi:hypothetical protein